MPTSGSAGLVAAIVRINNASRVGVADDEKYKAVEQFCLALKLYSQDEDLWEAIYRQAGSSHLGEVRIDIGRVRDVLSEAHVSLLRSAGYVFPPPPSARQVVEEARNALSEPLWTMSVPLYPEIFELHRLRLYNFACSVEERIQKRPSGGLARAFNRCRRLGAFGVLAIALSHVEVKTGPEFGVEVVFSTENVVTVEITALPELGSWTSAQLVRAQIVSLDQAIELADSGVEPGGPDGPSRGPQQPAIDSRSEMRAERLPRVSGDVDVTAARDDSDARGRRHRWSGSEYPNPAMNDPF